MKKYSKKGTKRHIHLLPDGEPKYVRCYDNGGRTADRYTIVFSQMKTGLCHSVACSENPTWPQGVWSYDETRIFIDQNRWGFTLPIGKKNPYLGLRIPYSALPDSVKKEIVDTYCELWNLEK